MEKEMTCHYCGKNITMREFNSNYCYKSPTGLHELKKVNTATSNSRIDVVDTKEEKYGDR